MKIIINEIQLKNILSELLLVPQDIENIRSWNEEVIHEDLIGPFIIFLTKSKYGNRYQVGLTTDGVPCSTRQSQEKRETCIPTSAIIKSYPKVVEKISEWINNYGELNVGSYNEKKINQYHKVFTHFGLPTTDIQHAMGGYLFKVG